MPTGYTADVQNGKISDFQTFALQCARAFGALVEMRDDPRDAPLPERIEPHGYCANQFREALDEINRLSRMTPVEVEAAATKDHADAAERWGKRRQDRIDQRARYEAMLAKVEAWTPPSDDHEGLKKFMAEQLRESINFDCTDYPDPEPVAQQPGDWLWAQLAEAGASLVRYEKEWRKEVERANDKDKWLQDLRASLTTTSPDNPTAVSEKD